MSIKTTVITSTLVAVVSAAITMYFTHSYLTTKHSLEVTQMVMEHEKAVRIEVEKVRAVETQLNMVKEDQVREYEASKSEIKKLESRVATLIRNGNVRLRNPNQSSCPTTADSTTGTADSNNGTGGSELPTQTAEFLWSEASRADAIVAKLTACQKYIKEITQTVNIHK